MWSFILFRESSHNQDSIQDEFEHHDFLSSLFAARKSTYVDLVCKDIEQIEAMPRWLQQEAIENRFARKMWVVGVWGWILV